MAQRQTDAADGSATDRLGDRSYRPAAEGNR